MKSLKDLFSLVIHAILFVLVFGAVGFACSKCEPSKDNEFYYPKPTYWQDKVTGICFVDAVPPGRDRSKMTTSPVPCSKEVREHLKNGPYVEVGNAH